MVEEIVAEDQANNPELFVSTAAGGLFPEMTTSTTDEAGSSAPLNDGNNTQ